DYASLSPQIFEAAQANDPLATDLLKRGASYLETAFAHLDPDPMSPICLTGGLGPRYADWLAAPYAKRLTDMFGTALDGALLLAQRQRPIS
ncbi:hypothetical protein N9C96_01120, partial [bacterium]|nr:hypothetical protein [bacterium]